MTNTNSNIDQNKSPVLTPGNQNKTPEQLALDKKNEQSKSTPSNDHNKKDETNSSEKKI